MYMPETRGRSLEKYVYVSIIYIHHQVLIRKYPYSIEIDFNGSTQVIKWPAILAPGIDRLRNRRLSRRVGSQSDRVGHSIFPNHFPMERLARDEYRDESARMD